MVAALVWRIAPPASPKGAGTGQSGVRGHNLPQTFVCTRRASANTHIYPSVLQAVSGRGYAGRLEWVISGGWGGDMQDLGYELPRNPIPRTRVNKGKKKGRGCEEPRP